MPFVANELRRFDAIKIGASATSRGSEDQGILTSGGRRDASVRVAPAESSAAEVTDEQQPRREVDEELFRDMHRRIFSRWIPVFDDLCHGARDRHENS